VCDKVLLIVGSANRNFEISNPLTIFERKKLVEHMIERENINDRILDIREYDDCFDNLAWVDGIIKSNPEFDLVIGNNSLVSVLTEYRKINQFHPKLTKREKHQGKIIRHAIVENRVWKDLVPEYCIDLLDEFGFDQRLRDLSMKMD